MKKSNINKKSLPLEHLSYDYIGNCSKKKELEDILRCLRNGEEGYFPDLTKFAENRLRDVAPNSIVLRETTNLINRTEVPPELRKELDSSLDEWEKEIKCADSALKKSVSALATKLPPVRSAAKLQKDSEKSTSSASSSTCQNTRIKRDDYKSWDKFDVDNAILKMDIDEERRVEEAKKTRLVNEKRQKDLANLNMNHSVEPENYSPEEAKILSEKAREKGNEYFKEKDWSRAYACYSESHQLHPNCAACNNRAMTLIKLGRYEEAVIECNYVLDREPDNVKALLRRSTAYKSAPNIDNWRRALVDLERVISLEPNNKTAQSDYQALRKQFNLPDTTAKARRLEIEEIPRERLPLTYYGPSTSSFRCERNSLTHQMLAGPRMMCGDGVPCHCNRGAMKKNPICKNCGEREMRQLLEKSKYSRRAVPQSMCATYVVQEKRKKELALLNRLDVVPRAILDDKQPAMISGPNVGGTMIINKNDVHNTGVKFAQMNINEKPNASGEKCPLVLDGFNGTADAEGPADGKRSAMSCNGVPSVDNKECEESRERQLALKAKERGLDSAAADDLNKALAYYTTSLNLYPDGHTLLLRAGIYEKLKKYTDAVIDYTRVLETEPHSLNALVGRIAAMFKVVPRNYKLIKEYVDNAYELRPDNSEIRMFRMVVMNEFLNTAKGVDETVGSTLSDRPRPIILDSTASSRNSSHEKKIGLKVATATEDRNKTTSTPTNVNQLPEGTTNGTTNGHGPHLNVNCCSQHTPEEKKHERNQRNKKKKKRACVGESPSQENVENIALDPSRKSNLSNGNHANTKVMRSNDSKNQGKETELLPSGFQFYSCWEACKKHDPDYQERLDLLRRVPPKLLPVVIGEKLDAEMLTDLVHCLELLPERKDAAEYVQVLPQLQRFQTIKLFMDDDYSQRMDRIMNYL